jgi:DNA-binding LacI/PurR family transcriptional regulator
VPADEDLDSPPAADGSGRQAPVVPPGVPTLDAIAAIAGVSRATVSRVINGSPRVSPSARDAVQAAVAATGYQPNRAARSLVTRRTDSVALVVSEPDERVFGDPFFGRMVRGISQAFADTPLQLVLLMGQSPQERERLGHYLRNGHVDGVLLISLHGDDPLAAHVINAGLPAVIGGRPPASAAVSYVDADNEVGAHEAVCHLVGSGRRRIATITGPADMSAGVDRLRGYDRALRESDLPNDPALVVAGDFTEASGDRAIRELLQRAPDVDAVFAASDLMAVGALRALRAVGRRVPDDIAVVGFDDSIRFTEPALTTVRQPIEQMGAVMSRILIDELDDRSRPRSSVVLPTELVVRDSS